MIIAITGTPGTGKTTLAKKLAKKLDYPILDVNEFIKEHEDVVLEYDKERETKIVEENMLIDLIVEHIKTEGILDLIVESHLAHYLPSKVVGKCLVLSCDLKKLKERLEERGYNELKIKENLEAETFDTILQESMDEGHDVIQIDTSKKFSLSNIVKQILPSS